MWQSSRKCACRRELNSHEAAKPQVRFGAARWLEATRPTDGTNQSNSLISVRAGVSAGQSKLTGTPPEAARRFSSEHIGPNVSARMNEGTHNSHRASGSVAKVPDKQNEPVVRAARRAVQCKVSGARRRRLLLPWRGAGSTMSGMQMHFGLPAARTDAEPLAQAERQRQATRPGLAVRGTFSPARAWRPAVVARLARTLGFTNNAPACVAL